MQRERQVRTAKESKQERGTHKLEGTEGGTSQKQPKKSKREKGTHRLESVEGGES